MHREDGKKTRPTCRRRQSPTTQPSPLSAVRYRIGRQTDPLEDALLDASVDRSKRLRRVARRQVVALSRRSGLESRIPDRTFFTALRDGRRNRYSRSRAQEHDVPALRPPRIPAPEAAGLRSAPGSPRDLVTRPLPALHEDRRSESASLSKVRRDARRREGLTIRAYPDGSPHPSGGGSGRRETNRAQHSRIGFEPSSTGSFRSEGLRALALDLRARAREGPPERREKPEQLRLVSPGPGSV